MILLQRCVLVGKRDDALNQVLTILGIENGHSVGAPRIEVQFFRLSGVLEHLPCIIGITIIHAVNEQLGGGDSSDLVIAQFRRDTLGRA